MDAVHTENPPLAPEEDDIQGSTQGIGPEGASDGEINEDGDLLATLREKRTALKEDHSLDLDLPGYDGLLVARFRPFPLEKQEKKMAEFQRAQGKQPILLKAACDTLIDACEQLMVRKPGQDEPVPIDPDALPPIAFDDRAAKLFKFEAKTARQVVIGLFPTEQSILAMNIRVSNWMTDVTRETDEELLGES